jgi:hypothetical protein
MSQATIAWLRAKGSGASVERSGTRRHSPTGLKPEAACSIPLGSSASTPFVSPTPALALRSKASRWTAFVLVMPA